MKSVIGWTDTYTSPYRQESFTSERRKALIERIKKRRYNFTYNDHCYLPFAAPFYDDNVFCALTKPEWDSVINEAYQDTPFPTRLMPQDAIERQPINGVLYEKEKFEPKVGENNG